MNVREKQRKLRWSAALVSVALLAHGASVHAANTATIGQPGRDAGGVQCSQDEYLAGFAVLYADSMGSLQPYCVGMQQDGAWKSGAQVHVDRSMGDAPAGRRLDLFCGKDSYAFGFTGFSHVFGIKSLMQLTLICRNPRTGAQSTFGTTKPSGPSLTEWPTVLCEANSVATGVFGTTTNGRLTQFGLSCARTPQALVQAADTSDRPNLEAAPPRTLEHAARETALPAPGEDRGIIIVGGKQVQPGDEVQLNPQPLPPKDAVQVSPVPSATAALTRAPLAASETLAPVSAPAVATAQASATSNVNPAQDVLLNPQPLPPKSAAPAVRETTQPAPGQDRGIIIVGGKQVQPGDEVQLNPQPLPPKGATQASAVSSASANATTTSTATAKRTRAPVAGSEVLQPDSATATAATTQPSATSKVYPAQDVLLNPQPLPPQGAVLQKRQQPVLVSSPSTPLSSGSTRANTKLQQSPLAGSATGPATAAGNLQAHEIVCRGGETLAIARVSEAPPPESTLTSIMYFNPSAQPGGTDGSGFEPGQCGYITESWANPHAEIIEFTTRPGDGPGSLVELEKHLNLKGFWSFRVREDERGFFVADQHAKWLPGRGPRQEAVRIKQGVTDVEMRVRGPARARVTATLHAPVSGADGGTLYGPPLGGISLTGQRVQESGEYLLSTEKSGPKLEPGELYYYVVTVDPRGDDEDAQFHRGGFRTLTTHATAGTAIAGSATSPIAAAAGSPVNPLPVAERVEPQPTDAIQGEGAGARTDAKVDCVNKPPRIAHVRGAITPGGQFTIAGMCFGTAPGQVEINGQFAGGTLKPDSQWGDSNVVVQIPATPPIAALASHKVAISVIRAPDGRKSAALAADFRGEPLRVRVPDHLWTPSARFQKTDVAERSTSFGALPFSSTGFAEKTFSQAFRVAINPGCRLDTVDVPATTGRIVSIEGWQGPDPHQDEVTVTWTRRCETTEHYYVITGEKTTECSAAFSLEAWAICPRGVSVNP